MAQCTALYTTYSTVLSRKAEQDCQSCTVRYCTVELWILYSMTLRTPHGTNLAVLRPHVNFRDFRHVLTDCAVHSASVPGCEPDQTCVNSLMQSLTACLAFWQSA
ncbi:hypothetical protein BCV69DRAFT_281596 [Microstroma glucosiphilum]|uniref:Uncharacterized protein n=1 Tax=Pseudomicrostroma glucosiphilum TaxID=1684307 RepID=A0A316UBJ9_9BASI|nr:hypothetical protein BCV69DRAFT_281596 [Pseudomicrostroma glucosiphilum]PWN22607.1 hypothetical protein BCV69DRAFT_281596 [Pseudomicrostroma glucosiphilum]